MDTITKKDVKEFNVTQNETDKCAIIFAKNWRGNTNKFPIFAYLCANC